MSVNRLVFTQSAKADLKAIAAFTQRQWGVGQRNEYLKKIDRVFQSIAERPQMGGACNEILDGYRRLPHGAHVIYYKLRTADEVLIVRVLHRSMDVETNLGA